MLNGHQFKRSRLHDVTRLVDVGHLLECRKQQRKRSQRTEWSNNHASNSADDRQEDWSKIRVFIYDALPLDVDRFEPQGVFREIKSVNHFVMWNYIDGHLILSSKCREVFTKGLYLFSQLIGGVGTWRGSGWFVAPGGHRHNFGNNRRINVERQLL